MELTRRQSVGMPSRNDRRRIDKNIRAALAAVRCPAHGGAPANVRITWSQDERGQEKTRVQVDPCCDTLDELSKAAITRAAGASVGN